MSSASPNGGGQERLDAAKAARGRADLVSGLRGLARRPGVATPRRDAVAGAGSGTEAPPWAQNGDPYPDAEEHCELCGNGLPSNHRHLLHLDERRMLCACETCWSVRSGEASFRPAGVRTAWLDDFAIPDDAWASFQIPIGLAFFMVTGDPQRAVAFYPSPAGATESEIDDAAWQRLKGLEPSLEALEPDCEALIVNRMSDAHQHVIAPIDECYRLVGMIKTTWEGISGGPGPQEAIERFFIELRIKGASMARTDV